MVVAKCSSCKNKTTLQACEVCEEAKCITCAQQHLTEYQVELKRKWLTLETRFQSIKQQTNTRRNILTSLRKKADEQLSGLTEDYRRKLSELTERYNEFRKEMNLSKTEYDDELNQSEKQWNALKADELFQRWTAIQNSSRFLLQEDTSNIERILTEIESSLSKTNNHNLVEYTFVLDANISLGELNSVNHIDNNDDDDMYATRKLYYTELTSTPRYQFNISILPRFISVYQSFIYICDLRGTIEKYLYQPPANSNLIESFSLESDKQLTALSCFALTSNFIITNHKDSDCIMIHNYQGILKNTIKLGYQPKHIFSSFDSEDVWICSDIKKVCMSIHLDAICNFEKSELIEYDQVQPVRLHRVNDQFLVHDSRGPNGKTIEARQDSLLLYNSSTPSKKQPPFISLDFIKDESTFNKARLFHPIMDNEGFMVIKHVPDCTHDTHEELVVVDMNDPKNLVVLNRIKLECVFGVTFTTDNKLIMGISPLRKQQRKIFIF